MQWITGTDSRQQVPVLQRQSQDLTYWSPDAAWITDSDDGPDALYFGAASKILADELRYIALLVSLTLPFPGWLTDPTSFTLAWAIAV